MMASFAAADRIPTIEAFIEAKPTASVAQFNLSVLVTTSFVKAVKDDGPWDLIFRQKIIAR